MSGKNRNRGMRVAFVAPRFHTNQYFVVKTLLERGNSVRFYAQYIGASEEHSLLKPVLIQPILLIRAIANLKFNNIKENAENYMRFMRKCGIPNVTFLIQLIKFKPDIVILREISVPNIVIVLLCRFYKVPVLLYTQVPLHKKKREYGKIVEKLVRLIKGIIPETSYTPILGDARESVVAHRHYIPFVIETDQATEKRKYFESGRVKIITVGKLQERKNHILLVDVLGTLRDRHDFTLTIVAECTTDKHKEYLIRLQSCIQNNNLGDRVTIKKNLSFPEVKAILGGGDLFILPSVKEPASVSILEAMACGLAVISSDSNGTQCYVNVEKNGLIFKSNDIEDLKSKIEKLLSDPDSIRRMGQNSYMFARTVYGPDAFYKRFLEVVETVSFGGD